MILNDDLSIVVPSLIHVGLCDPVNCSTCGSPVHYLPELAQTRVHRVGDAIQPSHSVSSPSPPAFSLSQHQGLFQWVSSSHQVTKVLELQFQHHSFQWMNIQDWLPLGWTGLISLQPRNSQESSPAPQFTRIDYSVLNLLYGPTVTSIHVTLLFSRSVMTLCDPMDCSTPVLHHLLKLAQTRVHRVGDAIQPSHPLLSPSPPTFSPSQHQGLFQWVSSSHQVAKVLELQLQHQSFQWILRTDLL